MRFNLLCGLFLLLGTTAFGQTKLDKIRDFLEKSGAAAIWETTIQNSVNEQFAQYGEELGSEIKDSTLKWASSAYPVIIDSIVLLYDKYYTEQDIDELLTFYDSRVGKKAVELTPKITEESMKIGSRWGRQNQAALEAMVLPIIQKEKAKFTFEGLYDSTEQFQRLTPYRLSTPASATTSSKSPNHPYTLHYDPNQWSISDCQNINAVGEICLISNDGKSYAILIAEKEDYTLKQLKAVALSNFYQETRNVDVKPYGLLNVNEVELLRMQFNIELDGYDLHYINSYFAHQGMILQLITFCLEDEFMDIQQAMEDLNNGISFE